MDAADLTFAQGLSDLVTTKPLQSEEVEVFSTGPTCAPDSPQYQSLNDAARYRPELAEGNTEVWYYRVSSQPANMYAQWIFQRDPALLPSKQELPKTHTLLGKIRCTDKDAIFEALQGNAWSPDGEAYTLIRENGLDHTTMRSADALVINGEALFCSHMGWISMRNDETPNNRAESNQDNSQERRCTKCGKTGVPLKKCSRCKNAHYCGIACQKGDWNKHKPTCHAP